MAKKLYNRWFAYHHKNAIKELIFFHIDKRISRGKLRIYCQSIYRAIYEHYKEIQANLVPNKSQRIVVTLIHFTGKKLYGKNGSSLEDTLRKHNLNIEKISDYNYKIIVDDHLEDSYNLESYNFEY